MGKLRPGHEVSYGKHARQCGAAARVGADVAAIRCHIEILDSRHRGRAASNGNEDDIGDERFPGLEGDRHLGAGLGHRGDTRAESSRDPTSAEGAQELSRDGGLLGGHELGEGFDDRHLGPQRTQQRGELDPDDATAQNDGPPGHLGQGECLIAGDDPVRKGEPRKCLAHRPGGQDEVPTTHEPFTDGDRVRVDDAALAGDHLDGSRGHEPLQPLEERPT